MSPQRIVAVAVGRMALLLAALVTLLAAARALGQAPLDARAAHEPPPLNQAVPEILGRVGIEEHLGAPIPGDARFAGGEGRPVALREILNHGKPVLLVLVYFDCPMLCGLVLGGVTRAMRQTGLALGRDFTALTVSFDPRDTPAVAAARQSTYLAALGKPDARSDWPFLTGRERDIQALTRAVGFGYAFDERIGQYAHTAAVVVLMPDGRVSRYLYGIDFSPRDLRLALVEAGGGRVGTTIDRVLLTCYRYDPTSRRYEPYVLGILRLSSAAVAVALAVALGIAWRREWRKGGVR
jgi:protein SCO1/2